MTTPDPGDELLRRLEAARRRLRDALPGSPDEDAAWNAVQALEEALDERTARMASSADDDSRDR